MSQHEQIDRARELFRELLDILTAEGESNWRKGVQGALSALDGPVELADSSGFEAARSIYRTMTQGGRGLSEFYARSFSENARLDEIRRQLWDIFNDPSSSGCKCLKAGKLSAEFLCRSRGLPQMPSCFALTRLSLATSL